MAAMPTFGDFADQASGHLDTALAFTDGDLSGGSVTATVREVGRVTHALSRYLDDIAPYGEIEAITSQLLSRRMRSIVDARQALRLAAQQLGSGRADAGDLARADALTKHIAAAATSLTAGRDLLHTHHITEANGVRSDHPGWPAVVASAPVTRALLAEIATWSRKIAYLTARLSVMPRSRQPSPALTDQGPASACCWLLLAGVSIDVAQHANPADASGTRLLMAIPASSVPSPLPLRIPETASALFEGVVVSATRLYGMPYAAGEASWSPEVTAESLRWSATAIAVTCHVSQSILRSLSKRIDGVLGQPAIGVLLRNAARASVRACTYWRRAAGNWDQITTESTGLASAATEDTNDLIVRLGRLAFADPGWTPSRSRHARLRHPYDLAPRADQARMVVTAVHYAATAMSRIAAADLSAVTAAVRGQRLYMPTRALPDGNDVIYRFGNATPADARDLVSCYQAAVNAVTRVATQLDTIALTLDTPSWVLAAARAAVDQPWPVEAGDGVRDQPLVAAAIPPADQDAGRVPGPVEQAVRDRRASDPVLLLRAVAIDSATRKLLAEAELGGEQPAALGPVKEQPPGPARSAAVQASTEDFPDFPARLIARHAGPRSGDPERAVPGSGNRTAQLEVPAAAAATRSSSGGSRRSR
jgi:hypothetical protein